MKELFTRLDEEVGHYTDNDSLKKSLSMMKQLVQSVKDERRGFWSNWFD
jgi:hypothetical protein